LGVLRAASQRSDAILASDPGSARCRNSFGDRESTTGDLFAGRVRAGGRPVGLQSDFVNYRAPRPVHKILRGAKPAELPVWKADGVRAGRQYEDRRRIGLAIPSAGAACGSRHRMIRPVGADRHEVLWCPRDGARISGRRVLDQQREVHHAQPTIVDRSAKAMLLFVASVVGSIALAQSPWTNPPFRAPLAMRN
jgi:hypothetical protein